MITVLGEYRWGLQHGQQLGLFLEGAGNLLPHQELRDTPRKLPELGEVEVTVRQPAHIKVFLLLVLS